MRAASMHAKLDCHLDIRCVLCVGDESERARQTLLARRAPDVLDGRQRFLSDCGQRSGKKGPELKGGAPWRHIRLLREFASSSDGDLRCARQIAR